MALLKTIYPSPLCQERTGRDIDIIDRLRETSCTVRDAVVVCFAITGAVLGQQYPPPSILSNVVAAAAYSYCSDFVGYTVQAAARQA